MKKVFGKILTLVVSFLFVTSFITACAYKDGKKFDKLDKNNDQALTSDEWNEKFKKMDSDGDGKVTKEEMKNYKGHKSK